MQLCQEFLNFNIIIKLFLLFFTINKKIYNLETQVKNFNPYKNINYKLFDLNTRYQT